MNLSGMNNLGFLGVYDTYYLAYLYGIENLQNLFYLEIVRSHVKYGYGTFYEYPIVNSVNEFIPFREYPPNLRFLNLSAKWCYQ